MELGLKRYLSGTALLPQGETKDVPASVVILRMNILRSGRRPLEAPQRSLYGLGSLNLVKLYEFEDKSSDLKVKNN